MKKYEKNYGDISRVCVLVQFYALFVDAGFNIRTLQYSGIPHSLHNN